MKFVTYKKYQPGDLDSLDMQELVNRLADFFLQSGFTPAYDYMNEMDAATSKKQLVRNLVNQLSAAHLLERKAIIENRLGLQLLEAPVGQPEDTLRSPPTLRWRSRQEFNKPFFLQLLHPSPRRPLPSEMQVRNLG